MAITDLAIRPIIPKLIERLFEISTGAKFPLVFYNLIISVLEIPFYPSLIDPLKKHEIPEGRKRIDIRF